MTSKTNDSLVKRTVYVEDDVWNELMTYYRRNGADMSKAIRAYMATDIRRLREEGKLGEQPEVKL